MTLPQSTILGRVDYREVLEYIDTPQIFITKSESGSLFICVLIAEQTNTTIYIYCEITPETLSLVRNSEMDYYTAFKTTEKCLVVSILHDKNEDHAAFWPIEWVEDEMLPLPGEYYDCF